MDAVVLWFKEYWAFALGLVAVLICAFFVFRAAGKSYKRYYSRYRQQEAEIKRLLALKEKYAVLTKETLENADESELLEGTALSCQLVLQKCENMEAAFAALSKEKQYIYALDVFVSDASVQTFYKENGAQLTKIAADALAAIGLEEAAGKARKIERMYDETDETTSVSQSEIDKTEKWFAQHDILTNIKLYGARYIKEHYECFVS